MFNKREKIGLEIGTSSVKYARLKSDGVIQVGFREIEFSVDEELREEATLSALADLLEEINAKDAHYIVNANCPMTSMVKTANTDALKPESGVKLTAKDYFPFAIDNAFVDYKILGQINEDGVDKLKLLVVASPIEVIKKYSALFQGLNIHHYSFIPTSISIQKVIELFSYGDSNINAVLYMGGNFSELAIFRGKNFIFSRKILITGDDITKALTGIFPSSPAAFTISHEEAESIKRNIGIPSENDEGLVCDKFNIQAIREKILIPLNTLSAEIKNCFDYCFQTISADVKINSLIITGGAARLKKLPEFLYDRFKINITKDLPLKVFKIDYNFIKYNKVEPSQLILAIGNFLSKDENISLMPQDKINYKILKKVAFRYLLIILIFASLLIILIFALKLINS